MSIDMNGNVGIGTTAPNALLHIFAPTTIVDSNGQLFVCASDALGADKGGQIMLGARYTSTLFTAMGGISAKKNNATDNDYNGYLQFFTSTQSVGNTEKMRITSAGSLLIGTTNADIGGGAAGTIIRSDGTLASAINMSSPAGYQAPFTADRMNTAGNGLMYGMWRAGIFQAGIGATNTQSMTFIVAGDGSNVNQNIRMTITSNGSIGAPNGTNIYNASDARLKKNISTTTYGLDTISALNPVKFNWVDGFEPTEDGKDMLGFVAQEVQTVIPEAVESFGGNSITVGDTTIENPLRVNEKFIIPVLVKAIQELKSENDTLKEILQRNNIQ
jgi:hypothetical protein